MSHLKVLKVIQPIGEFYIGSIASNELLAIATKDIRRFSEGKGDSIDGIQRELSKGRLKELKEYVNLDYATFPTSVILAIDERCVKLESIEGCNGLYDLQVIGWGGNEDEDAIPLNASAFVIDGQHRLAGLEARNKEKGPFEINVSIFVGADIADQAEIFSRVNLAQTKVNKSLMYDLLDYAKENSPFKTAHDVTVALNRDEGGPFHRKIKRLGVRTPNVDSETLAQATVVNGILRHLPKNQELERSKSILGWGSRSEANENWRDRIFVQFYRDDDIVSILIIISNFFEAVRKRWPQAWEDPEPGQILCRTTGYNAFIRFLRDAYVSVTDSPRVVRESEFLDILKRITLSDKDLSRDKFLPGSSGAGELYRILLSEGLGEDG